MQAVPELATFRGTGCGYRMYIALVVRSDHPLMSRAAFDRLRQVPQMSSSNTITTYSVAWIRHLEGMSLLGWTLSVCFFLQAWVHGLVPRLHDAGRTFYDVSVAGRDHNDAVLTPFQPGQVARSFEVHCHTKYHVSIQDA